MVVRTMVRTGGRPDAPGEAVRRENRTEGRRGTSRLTMPGSKPRLRAVEKHEPQEGLDTGVSHVFHGARDRPMLTVESENCPSRVSRSCYLHARRVRGCR